MSITGLANLGFSQAGSQASGAKSSGKGKTSFETVLGQAQKEKATANKTVRAEEQKPKAQSEGSFKESSSQNRDQNPTPQRQNAKPEPRQNAHTETTAKREILRKPLESKPSASDNLAASKSSTEAQEPIDADATEVRSESVATSEVKADNGESLPSKPTLPIAGNPGINERIPAAPVNAKATSPVGKAAAVVPAAKEDPADSLTRRVVWNDFLRKMNQLGVSAEDVVVAFGSLSEKDLAQAPELSVDKVVMALGLDGHQAVLAKQYFNELIQKTQPKSLGAELAISNKQVGLTLMSQAETERKNLSSSLDRMNSNFFMTGPAARPAKMPADATVNDRSLNAAASPVVPEWAEAEAANFSPMNPIGAPGFNPAMPVKAAEVSGASQATPPLAGAKSAPNNVNELLEQMRELPQNDRKGMEALLKNFNAHQAAGVAPTTNAAPLAAGLSSAAAPIAAPSTAIAALNSIFGGAGGNTQGDGDDASDDASQGSSFAQNLTSDARLSGPMQNAKAEFQNQLVAQGMPQPPRQAMGVQDLVQQAHVMIKDGGGEMKVTLHPDGLGEVAMRVSLENGKVTVQMVTESDEAKKLIEHQIGDLKSTLAQNHLQVESIKVDTASNLGKQLEQQYQDAQRQQAQASLEQFRQDHQGWRRSFFDTGAVRPYQSQADAPRDVRAPSASQKSKDGARRLDLVA